MGQRKHVIDGGAQWRHLANKTEPFMCDGNAALCQITLTTCRLHPLLVSKTEGKLTVQVTPLRKPLASSP